LLMFVNGDPAPPLVRRARLRKSARFPVDLSQKHGHGVFVLDRTAAFPGHLQRQQLGLDRRPERPLVHRVFLGPFCQPLSITKRMRRSLNALARKRREFVRSALFTPCP